MNKSLTQPLTQPLRHAVRALSLCLPLWGLAAAPAAQASVVLSGTRVVYQAGQHGKTLQLSNEDAHPNLVQIWVDDEAPFVLNPPIFRMEPHTGQMVRMRISDEGLPQDRESLFYLNFTQVPALDDKVAGANRLVLLFQSRVKLFYRPVGLPSNAFSCDSVRMHRLAGKLQVENTTPYHMVVMHADLRADGRDLPLVQSDLLEPFAKAQWAWPREALANGAAALVLTLRNDYGADISHECEIA